MHGSTAELRDAATGAVKPPAPTASVDLERRQIDVRVPHAAWNPGTGKVRLAAGVGLWDPAGGDVPRAVAAPQRDRARRRRADAAPRSSTSPSATTSRCPRSTTRRSGWTIGDAAAGAAVEATWWREKAQAEALRLGDISAFFAEVDFGKLAAKADDDSRRPDDRPDQPHPRQPARVRPGRRPHEGLLRHRLPRRPSRARSARAATSASCSPTRSTCRRSRSPRGLRPDAAAALAVGELQPVHGLEEPVAARRPRSGHARRDARRARARRLLRGRSPRPTRSRCGPTSRATTRSTRTGRRDRLLDGRLRHLPACSPAGPTCSRAAMSTVGTPGVGRTTSSRRCATRRS